MSHGGPQQIRLLIVDDHDLFRTGLSSLVSAEPDVSVVAQASGGRMAVRLAKELRPDVILMDLRMPDLDGVEAARQITADDPAARIVILTVSSDEAAVTAAVRAGASGYLVKDSPIEDVLGALRAAARGDAWLSPLAADALLERVRAEREPPQRDASALDSLTQREVDVLRRLAQGHENTEIAAELGISNRTAKNHVSAILGKLGVSNRVQAAVFAVQHGVE
jgi:DNA-binding NarL/FixJ family response regulator